MDIRAGEAEHTGFSSARTCGSEALKIVLCYLSHCCPQTVLKMAACGDGKVVCALAQLPRGGGVLSRTHSTCVSEPRVAPREHEESLAFT